MNQQKPHTTPPGDMFFDWRRYVSMIQAQTTVCCAIVLVVSLCGLVVAFSLPKKYAASSTVFIEQNVISDLVKGIAITPSMEAKMRILKVSLLSRDMLQDVTRTLDMDLQFKTAAEQERYFEKLRNTIEIVHDEKKGLFFITYTNKNPVIARDFVNTLTRKFIESSTASSRTESLEATSFLAEQINMFQKRREKAQQAIDSFKVEKGMFLGLNEQLLREQIRDTEQQMDSLRIQKAERQAKLTLMSTSSSLRKDLEAKEQALQSLLASYTERYPAVITAKEDIKRLKASIEKEEQNGDDKSTDINYQTVLMELRSLESRERFLEDIVAKNTEYLQKLPEIRTELAALEQSKNNENTIYQQLVARYGQSEVSKQMELQDKAVSFRIIDAAVLPNTYTFPNRALLILGGIFAGFAFVALYIVAQDILHGKIRSRADLEKMHLEVLATLPSSGNSGLPEPHKISWKILTITGATLMGLCLVALMEYFRLPYVDAALKSLLNRG